MSSLRFTIKKVTVEEQHEEFINEIKNLKIENESLKKLIMKLTFQTAGTVNEFLHLQKSIDFWEHVDP